MADDETILEAVDPAEFSGEPDKVIRERLTPLAFRKLYEMLHSDVPGVLDKAIDKAIRIDKRIREKDAVTTPNQTLVLNFNPEHLREVMGGIRGMFNGGGLEPPRLAPGPGEGVHGDGVGEG